jgi:outer membrane protein with beta-barrel domain
LIRTLRILLLVLVIAAPGYAQTIPSWEVFGGYSFQRSNLREYFRRTLAGGITVVDVRNRGGNLNGFDVSFTENINPWFGGTLDITGHFAAPEIGAVKTLERMYTVSYGPQFSYRKRPGWTAFGRVLAGAAHAEAKVTPTGPHLSDTSFALAAGGGLDMKFRGNTAIRILQAEYLHANSLGASQNNLRLSAGIILYFK